MERSTMLCTGFGLFAVGWLTMAGPAVAQQAPPLDVEAIKAEIRAEAARQAKPVKKSTASYSVQSASVASKSPSVISKQSTAAVGAVIKATPTASAAIKLPDAAKRAIQFVTLSASLQQRTQQLLAAQLKDLKAADPRQPAYVPFDGALVVTTPDEKELTLVAIALVDDALRFDPQSRTFVGRIAVGLVDLGYTGPAKTVGEGIGFQVMGAESAEPSFRTVESTSPPYPQVRISARDPEEGIELQVLSNLSEQPVKLVLPVARARLTLSAPDRSLQGWGLERVGVTVEASDGEHSKDQRVSLVKTSADAGGVIEPESSTLDASGIAQFVLTSESTGVVALRASGARFEGSEPMTFKMVPPWRYLLAALLGGIAGGLLRRGTKTRTGTKRLLRELSFAVLAGALVFGLFVLGVNVTGFPLPARGGEILVAVIAALGGLFGTRLVSPDEGGKPGARPA